MLDDFWLASDRKFKNQLILQCLFAILVHESVGRLSGNVHSIRLCASVLSGFSVGCCLRPPEQLRGNPCGRIQIVFNVSTSIRAPSAKHRRVARSIGDHGNYWSVSELCFDWPIRSCAAILAGYVNEWADFVRRCIGTFDFGAKIPAFTSDSGCPQLDYHWNGENGIPTSGGVEKRRERTLKTSGYSK